MEEGDFWKDRSLLLDVAGSMPFADAGTLLEAVDKCTAWAEGKKRKARLRLEKAARPALCSGDPNLVKKAEALIDSRAEAALVNAYRELFRFLVLWHRDGLLLSVSPRAADDAVNVDRIEALRARFAGEPPKALLRSMEAVEDAHLSYLSQVNPALVLENLFSLWMAADR
jgi:hypothetical protein